MSRSRQRRGLLKCIGLAPIALGAVACEADRRAGSTDARGKADGSAPDTGANSDAALDDAGFEDAGVQDAGHQHPSSCSPTGADLEGPFYRAGAPSRISR